MKKDNHRTLNNRITIIALIIAFCLLMYNIIDKPQFIKDSIAIILIIILYYFIEKKHPLDPAIYVIGFVPLFLHLVGVSFGIFRLLFFVGTDKYIHFFSSLSVTIIFFYWLIDDKKKRYFMILLVAFLVAQGFGAINEVNEFVGTHYFHVIDEGMFSQHDNLPKIFSDLQDYDTWWDMIFNLMGSLTGIVIIVVREKFLQRRALTLKKSRR